MEIRERIKVVIKVNQHTAASFADEIGVQRSSISHILNGRNKPSLDFIQKILRSFPRVDPMWLITGEESRFKTNINTPEPSKKEKPSTDSIQNLSSDKSKERKQVDRIVIFYTDRTFEAYEGS